VSEYDWVRNPFAVTNADTKHLSLKEAEEFAELQADRIIQLKFRETTLLQFWNLAKKKTSQCYQKMPYLHFYTFPQPACASTDFPPYLHFYTFPQPTCASRDFPDWRTLKIRNGSDFFLLIKNYGCVCLRFDPVLNNCTKVNQPIFLIEL
jgi:hypothetical protein